jgi:hypothetical protein
MLRVWFQSPKGYKPSFGMFFLELAKRPGTVNGLSPVATW